MNIQVLSISIILLGLSCAKDSKKIEIPDDAGSNISDKAKPDGQEDGSSLENNTDAAANNRLPKKGHFIKANYTIEVRSLLGIRVCKGEAEVKINASFGGDAKVFDIPEGKIKCLLGLVQIDLAQALASSNKDSNAETKIVDIDGAISFAQFGTVTFDPPRPFLPSLFSSKRKDLKNLDLNRQVTLTDEAQGQKATGNVRLFTKAMDEPYTFPKYEKTVEKTLEWRSEVTGFDGVKKLDNVLFDVMEMLWTLEPLAIPRVFIKGKLKDFLSAKSGDGGGGAAGGLLGGGGGGGFIGTIGKLLANTAKFEMTMELQEQENLNKSSTWKALENDDEFD